MLKNDTIFLSSGKKARIIRGDESNLVNSYIIQLEDGQTRVVDKETLSLAESRGDVQKRRTYFQ